MGKWLVAMVLVAAAVIAWWAIRGRGPGEADLARRPGPLVLDKPIQVFPAALSDDWRTDWSWKVAFRTPHNAAPMIAQVEGHGGVAFRDAYDTFKLRTPAVGYLVFVLDEASVQHLAVGLNDGKADLDPQQGIDLLSPTVRRTPDGPGRTRIAVSLSLFSGQPGRRIHKINLMSRVAGPVTVTIHEVSLLPADEEAARRAGVADSAPGQ